MNLETDSASAPSLPLIQIAKGIRCKITELRGDKELCRKLREMGVRENEYITTLLFRRNLVCLVNGSRFAINRTFAEVIRVIPANA